MKKQNLHITWQPETKSLYMADGDANKWTMIQGEKAELIHRILQEEIDNPPWAEAQRAELLNVNNTAQARPSASSYQVTACRT